VQLTFIGISPNQHPFTIFSNRPFLISSTFVLAIISAAGLQLLLDFLKHKTLKQIALFVIILLPMLPLIVNFSANNESKNYIAHDYNLNLLKSMPPFGYLISTGRDNSTFPLYYLAKIEHYRTDVRLEIYYGRNCVDKNLLNDRLKKSDQSAIFIDLLPCGYNSLELVPYNFVYAFGDISGLPKSDIEQFTIRGLRSRLDYPNSKLKGLYYLKLAYAGAGNQEKAFSYFDKILQEIPENEQFRNFIDDFMQNKDGTGMF
jgi:hypothetical protein